MMISGNPDFAPREPGEEDATVGRVVWPGQGKLQEVGE